MRRRSVGLALVGLLLAAGCSPSGVQYSAVPTAPAAPTRAAEASPAAPTGDAKLDAFLSTFAAALDRKDWRSIAQMLDAPTYGDLYDQAVAAGATPEEAAAGLIANALDLSTLIDPASPFAGLDRIRVVTIREANEINDGVIRVRGDVRLDDDSRLPLNAFVRSASGRFRIVLSRV